MAVPSGYWLNTRSSPLFDIHTMCMSFSITLLYLELHFMISIDITEST